MSTATPAKSQLTTEQARAIETREVSVSLSAGAGCGKTFVLTERFLDYFDPHDPKALRPDQLGQLIAITFTERAAREMRDRIRRKCYDRLQATDAQDAAAIQYWSQLVRFLDSARVSTIHAFCATLLRSHAVEAGLDPRFGVLEQTEGETVLSELIDDTLRSRLADHDEVTLNLLTKFPLEVLKSMLADLVNRRERNQFGQWLSRSADELVAVWSQFHTTVVVPAIVRGIASADVSKSLLDILSDEISSLPEMCERRAAIVSTLTAWQTAPPTVATAASDLAALREQAKMPRAKKGWVSDDLRIAYRDTADALRGEIDKVLPALSFDAAAAKPIAQVSLEALQLADRVVAEFTRFKTEHAFLDFDDLLIHAQRLLTDPAHTEVQRRLSDQMRLLLVDEFQDTDPLQVELVEALCGTRLAAGKLFFVGDHKQSIYRFRGADPTVFRDLRERTPAPGRLPLTRNFRSQPAILDFINALFHQELAGDYEPLIADRPQVSPVPSVEFLWSPAETTSVVQENKSAMLAREADWVARRLRAIIDSREPIVWNAASARDGKPAARAANYADIAILFRALTSVAEYEQALARYNLPYYLVGGHAFYAQQEIFDLVNLLRAIASPADALSLAGALRSPFFSLADETLFWLAQHPEGLATGLFVSPLPAPLDDREREKASFAARTILKLRSIKDRVPVTELINAALDLTGYDALLLADFMGERKLANLRKLIDQARSFDRSGLFTLADFILQLSEFVANQPKEPLAAAHAEGADVIRLMTIHAAKGLEFPIVVVPDLDRVRRGNNDCVAFTPTLGPMVSMPKMGGDGEKIVGGLELFKLVNREEDEQESRRLLYVATTRAADYLLLSGSIKSAGESNHADTSATAVELKATGPWTQMLSRHFDLNTGNFIDELPKGWNAPLIRAGQTMPETTAKPLDNRSRVDLAKLVTAVKADAAAKKFRQPQFAGVIAADPAARRQYSFSRLTGALHADTPEEPGAADSEYVLPATILDPLSLGTLVHAVLAEIDFAEHANGKKVDVTTLIARHADRHLEEPRGELEEAAEMLNHLLASPRARILATAKATFTELEFLLGWPPEEFAAGGTYLRGFIDRLWQDAAGDWHVLDFKTNRVTPNKLASTAAKYEMQMLVYALAVEHIFARPPKSLTLHFLRTGDEQTFEWNLASRKRVVKMVNDSLAVQVSPFAPRKDANSRGAKADTAEQSP